MTRILTMTLLMTALPAAAAAQAKESCGSFQALITATYNFKPSKLSDAEREAKVAAMDKVWDAAKARPKESPPCLRAALENPRADQWFQFDGSNLLLRMPNLSFISHKATAKKSPIHGTGLFAVAPIAQGEVVCVKGGYIFDRQALDAMPDWYRAAEIQVADGLFIGPRREDEREGGMIFSNHSCEPNIGVQGQIVFVAMRDIEAGEELTHDWATTDDDDYEMECRCGAASCRQVVTGRDWRRKDLQEKYRGYMSWYLAEKIKQTG